MIQAARNTLGLGGGGEGVGENRSTTMACMAKMKRRRTNMMGGSGIGKQRAHK